MESCLLDFLEIRTEEPYEGKLHVRICGGSGRVTGCFYPELLNWELGAFVKVHRILRVFVKLSVEYLSTGYTKR